MSLAHARRGVVLSDKFHAKRSVAKFPVLIIQEARGAVLFVYFLRSVAGAVLTPSPLTFTSLARGATATGSMLLAVTCVYLWNGLSDLEEDRVNRSRRPLASGRLTAQSVHRTIAVLLLLDVSAVFFVSPGVSVCNLAMVVLGLVYSRGKHPAKLHGTVALIVAGLGAALPYVSTAIATAGVLNLKVIVTTVMCGSWVWAGGAAKDLSDVAGDRTAGRSTLPVRVGDHRARVVIAHRLLLIGLVASLCVGLDISAPGLLVIPVFSATLALLSRRVTRVGDRSGARGLYRIFMVSQYSLNVGLIVTSVVA